MLRISLTKTACLLPLLALCLSGCGLTQRVSEGTKSAFNAVFIRKLIRCIWTLPRAKRSTPMPERITRSLNRWWCASISLKIARPLTGWFTSSCWRRGIFCSPPISPRQSRCGDRSPEGTPALNMPLEAEATFVAVVGLFRHPDTQRNTWKQVLAREELIRTSRAFSLPNTTSYGSGLKRRSNVKTNTCGGAIAPVRPQSSVTSERAITIFIQPNRFHHSTGDNVTARERFFKKLQQQQNPRRTAALDGSAAAGYRQVSSADGGAGSADKSSGLMEPVLRW